MSFASDLHLIVRSNFSTLRLPILAGAIIVCVKSFSREKHFVRYFTKITHMIRQTD